LRLYLIFKLLEAAHI